MPTRPGRRRRRSRAARGGRRRAVHGAVAGRPARAPAARTHRSVPHPRRTARCAAPRPRRPSWPLAPSQSSSRRSGKRRPRRSRLPQSRSERARCRSSQRPPRQARPSEVRRPGRSGARRCAAGSRSRRPRTPAMRTVRLGRCARSWWESWPGARGPPPDALRRSGRRPPARPQGARRHARCRRAQCPRGARQQVGRRRSARRPGPRVPRARRRAPPGCRSRCAWGSGRRRPRHGSVEPAPWGAAWIPCVGPVAACAVRTDGGCGAGPRRGPSYATS